MKIQSQPNDILSQIDDLLTQHDIPAERVRMPEVLPDNAPELAPIMKHVIDAVRGQFATSDELRMAIAETLITSRMKQLGSQDPNLAELTRSLLSDDPVFARLVDQTILSTTRQLAGI
jgi:hypothetical protein